MRLLEFQSKRLAAQHGVPTPSATLVTSEDDLASLEYPVVLKAQVPSGGRGKAGGILIAHDLHQALDLTGRLLGETLLGQTVGSLLAEELVDQGRELFLSLILDIDSGFPSIIASSAGGVDIEEVAHTHPEKIRQVMIHPLLGLQTYSVRAIGKILGLSDLQELQSILEAMYFIHSQFDASIVEINPLAETGDGLIAVDLKVVLDDKAEFRHEELFQKLRAEQEGLISEVSPAYGNADIAMGISYVPMEGNIGLISDGAGTGMLAIDLLEDLGGRPANFCEMGGLADSDHIVEAMRTVLSDTRVDALLITLIGGLTRMDHMGEGIAEYLSENRTDTPIVVRMCGTREDAGKEILRNIDLETYDDLSVAANRAVNLASGKQ